MIAILIAGIMLTTIASWLLILSCLFFAWKRRNDS